MPSTAAAPRPDLADLAKLVGPAIAKIVGPRIRALREARGMSLGDIERVTGLDPSNLSKIERGEYLTDVARYALLAVAFDVDLGTLFRGTLTSLRASNSNA
jgi:transcriptional regulator with XRE-family HTH domain